MLKPTPHSTTTPVNASQSPTLSYLQPFPIDKECQGPWAHGVMDLGAISDTIANRPSYRVGKGLHSISG